MICAHRVATRIVGSNAARSLLQQIAFSLLFPFCMCDDCQLSLGFTANSVYSIHCSLLMAFSLHFSSSHCFLRHLFTQSSHLTCGLARFLQPSCFFCLRYFRYSPVFHSYHVSSPFHPVLPTKQPLVPTSSRRYFIIILCTLFTLDMIGLRIQVFTHILRIVCAVAVRTGLKSPSQMY